MCTSVIDSQASGLDFCFSFVFLFLSIVWVEKFPGFVHFALFKMNHIFFFFSFFTLSIT